MPRSSEGWLIGFRIALCREDSFSWDTLKAFKVCRHGLRCCIATRALLTDSKDEWRGAGCKMDDLTTSELDQLLAVFRDQSLQILEEMGHDLLALESNPADADAMTRLRRGAHTIKGDSACIGLDG